MNRDLEHALRAALRPVDPGEAFTRQVLSRLASEPRAQSYVWAYVLARVWARVTARPALLALAASAVLAVAGASLWQVDRVHQGELARRQLLEALRVTDQTLTVAYRAANASGAGLPPSGT